MAQIFREHVHSRPIGLHFLFHCHIHFARRRKKTLVRILCRKRNLALALAAASQSRRILGHEIQNPFKSHLLVKLELHPEDTLLLSTPDGQIPVRRDRSDRLGKLVILLEFRGLRRLRGRNLALDYGLRRKKLTDMATDIRHIGNALGENIACVLKILL